MIYQYLSLLLHIVLCTQQHIEYMYTMQVIVKITVANTIFPYDIFHCNVLPLLREIIRPVFNIMDTKYFAVRYSEYVWTLFVFQIFLPIISLFLLSLISLNVLGCPRRLFNAASFTRRRIYVNFPLVYYFTSSVCDLSFSLHLPIIF